VTATTQLMEELRAPAAPGRLERGLSAIARHANPTLEPHRIEVQLDELADRHGDSDPAELCANLFGDSGLRPNTNNYYDPNNSLIDQVLARRRGIPLSLSAVALAVAERCATPLRGVAMPGHFLLADAENPQRFYDPFAGGRQMSFAEVAELHVRLLGSALVPEQLAPVGHRVMLLRTLANLRVAYGRHGDLEGLAWVLGLLAESRPPGTEATQELAVVLSRLGRWDEAAAACSALADSLGEGAPAERWRSEAARLRTLLN
jgi:regulator of sirC expression with transglutaminase-like and TPR domain